MRWFFVLLIYRLALPLLFVAAFPGWVFKMWRRGGFGTGLLERISIYLCIANEKRAAVHVHAVSVGEVMLALKLIRAWRAVAEEQEFVLAVGTSTGHDVATRANLSFLRVTYAPLDFRWMVGRYLNRFNPKQIVLIEGEAWPHLLLESRKRGLCVSLVNARMSPRSARRYAKFAQYLRPVFSCLSAVAIQEEEDRDIWVKLGVASNRVHYTGSLKFDPGAGELPKRRPEFQKIMDSFGVGRPLVLAASTHEGEDEWIAEALDKADMGILSVVVPRHAERRSQVKAALESAGFQVHLRSQWNAVGWAAQLDERRAVLVIDSTGELKDWMAHADVVVVGKSFLAEGGQNPAEAILAGKPVVFGPHMENFEPLSTQLVAAGGAFRVENQSQLTKCIQDMFGSDDVKLIENHGLTVLSRHSGATGRIIRLLVEMNL